MAGAGEWLEAGGRKGQPREGHDQGRAAKCLQCLVVTGVRPPRFSRRQLPLRPDKSCWPVLTVSLIFSNEAR